MNPPDPELAALHAVARAAQRHRDRTGTQGVLSEALDRLTASGWRPDGPESEEALAGLLGAANTQSSDKEKLADWMAANDFDTGHDGTMDQLLDELDGHVMELRARAPMPAEQPRCWPWRHLWQVTGQTVDRGWYGATDTTVMLRCARCGVRRREY